MSHLPGSHKQHDSDTLSQVSASVPSSSNGDLKRKTIAPVASPSNIDHKRRRTIVDLTTEEENPKNGRKRGGSRVKKRGQQPKQDVKEEDNEEIQEIKVPKQARRKVQLGT